MTGRPLRRRRRLRQATEAFPDRTLHRPFVLLLPPVFLRDVFSFFHFYFVFLQVPTATTTMVKGMQLPLVICSSSSFLSSFLRIGRLSSTRLSYAARGDDDDDYYRLLRTFLLIRAFQRLARPSADLMCDNRGIKKKKEKNNRVLTSNFSLVHKCKFALVFFFYICRTRLKTNSIVLLAVCKNSWGHHCASYIKAFINFYSSNGP